MAGNSKARKVALAASTAAVCVTLAGAGSAGAIGRYTDAAGDGNGAADITGVSVSSDANRQIVFTVSAASALAEGDSWVAILLDTDQNPATGVSGALGADYMFAVEADGWSFGRWTGADWDWDTPYATARIGGRANTLMITVNASELGGTGSFNFWTRSGRGDAAGGQLDDAPDDGTFNYALAAGGPDIREVAVQTTPQSGPRAGRKFVVRPTALTLPQSAPTLEGTPKPQAYRCAARVGAKTLRGTGAGACTFDVPKKAKRKRLAVTLTVEYQGASKSVQLVYVVR